MDRNLLNQSPILRRQGQARKSLWIETEQLEKENTELRGQARKSLWIETNTEEQKIMLFNGQARKSLWIET